MTRVCVGVRIQQLLSYPQGPDQPWGSLSLLASKYEGLFTRRQSSRDLKLTSHLYLLRRLRMRGAVLTLLYADSWHCALLGTSTALL
jgi:hypothetical protein